MWLQVAIQGIMYEEVLWDELHQGQRVQLGPWPSILSLCGGGTSRCGGRVSAHSPLHPSYWSVYY